MKKVITYILLMGLKYGVLSSEDSKMNYNGTIYPVEAWKEDLCLRDAFQKSFIWYFRKVIDMVGEEVVQNELSSLNYGNGDISKWYGSNTNPSVYLEGKNVEVSGSVAKGIVINVAGDLLYE